MGETEGVQEVPLGEAEGVQEVPQGEDEAEVPQGEPTLDPEAAQVEHGLSYVSGW